MPYDAHGRLHAGAIGLFDDDDDAYYNPRRAARKAKKAQKAASKSKSKKAKASSFKRHSRTISVTYHDNDNDALHELTPTKTARVSGSQGSRREKIRTFLTQWPTLQRQKQKTFGRFSRRNQHRRHESETESRLLDISSPSAAYSTSLRASALQQRSAAVNRDHGRRLSTVFAVPRADEEEMYADYWDEKRDGGVDVREIDLTGGRNGVVVMDDGFKSPWFEALGVVMVRNGSQRSIGTEVVLAGRRR